MDKLPNVLFCIALLQSCLLFPVAHAQQGAGDNLLYFGMEATTVLFNILQNPLHWESNVCPGVQPATQITNPGFGMDLLTNVVKYVEVILALATYNRNWLQYYCDHRRHRISKQYVIKKR